MFTENVQLRVEVFDDHVMIVLPKKMTDLMSPWQDAWAFSETLEAAANDVPARMALYQHQRIAEDSGRIRIATHNDKNVVLLFDHTDRIKLSPEAACLVARAIRLKAQDLQLLEEKGVRMTYKNGHHIPQWTHKKRVF